MFARFGLQPRPAAERARADAAHALEPGVLPAVCEIPCSWIDPEVLAYLKARQAVWDSARPEQREAARRRLSAIQIFDEKVAVGSSRASAYQAASEAAGMSPGTVYKWRGRYSGETPIERLISLLDDKARGRW